MPIARLSPPVVPSGLLVEGEVPTRPAPAKAAAPAIHCAGRYIALAYVILLVGGIVGWAFWNAFDPTGFKPAPDISAFAILYIFAQGIERLLEPVTKWVGELSPDLNKQKALAERNEAVEKLSEVDADPDEKLKRLAENQSHVDQVRANLTMVLWAVASFIAMLVCGAFGVLLLSGIGLDVPEWFDIAVTGLAIGSGTKALHDLISNVQKSKETKEDPPEVSPG